MTLHSVTINGVYQSAEVVHAVLHLQDQIKELEKNNKDLKAAAKQALAAMNPVAHYGKPGSRDVEQTALQDAIAALKAALGQTSHMIVSDGVDPHKGAYYYKCTKCGKSDWIASYGDLSQLNFIDKACK
jgi:hypothetical protein